MMEAERQRRVVLHQKKGKQDESSRKSTMEMMRVTMKQMHQRDMDQLPVARLQMPMSATREKATQVEKSCGGQRQRQQHVTSKKPLSQVSPQCTWAVLVWLVVDRVSLLEQAQGPDQSELKAHTLRSTGLAKIMIKCLSELIKHLYTSKAPR